MPSEAIKKFRYYRRARTLLITFQSGELYAYKPVEPEAAEAMARVQSKGNFFQTFIRGYYPYGKVEDPHAVRFKPAERNLGSRPPLPPFSRPIRDTPDGDLAWPRP